MTSKLFDIDNEYISVLEHNEHNNSDIKLDGYSEEIHICRRCKRPITDVESIINGMGPVCYRKYLCEKCYNKTKKLF